MRKYYLITDIRNEKEHVENTIEAIKNQILHPEILIV